MNSSDPENGAKPKVRVAPEVRIEDGNGYLKAQKVSLMKTDDYILTCMKKSLLEIRTSPCMVIKQAGIVSSVEFSPCGRFFAYGSNSSIVKVWNLHENREEFTGEHTKEVTSISFSPLGNLLASGSLDGFVKFWNIKDKREEYHLEIEVKVTFVVFSPDGNYLAFLCNESTLIVFSLQAHQYIINNKYEAKIYSISFSQDSKILALVCDNKTVTILKLEDSNYSLIKTHDAPVYSVYCFPDCKTFASGPNHSEVILWNLNENNQENLIKGLYGVISFLISPNGKFLAWKGVEPFLNVWSIETSQEELLLSYCYKDNFLCFSPNSTFLALILFLDKKQFEVWNIKEKRVELHGVHADSIYFICFSPDENLILTASNDKTLKIWNIKSKVNILSFSNFKDFSSACISPDGRLLALGSNDPLLTVWNLKTNNLDFEIKSKKSISELLFSPNNIFLVAIESDYITVFNLDTRTKVKKLSNGSFIYRIMFSSDSKKLAIIDSQAKIFDLERDSEEKIIESNDFSPDLNYLVCYKNNSISIYDRYDPNSKVLDKDYHMNDIISSAFFSPNNELIAIIFSNKNIEIITIDKQDNYIEIEDSKDAISYCFSSNNTFFAACFKSQYNCLVWNIENNQKEFDCKYDSYPFIVKFSPDSNRLVLALDDGTLKIRDMKNLQQELTEFNIYAQNSISFSNDSSLMVLMSKDFSVKIIQLNQFKKEEIITHPGYITSVCFSPDENFFASGCDSNFVYIFNLNTKKRKACQTHDNSIQSLCFSPDGNLLVSGSLDKKLKFWNIKQDRLEFIVTLQYAIYSAQYSLDGNLMAVYSDRYHVWVLNLKNELKLLKVIDDISHQSYCFSPDGKYMALGTIYKKVDIYFIIDMKVTFSINHADEVSGVCFSPDNKFLASVSSDFIFKVHDMTKTKEVITGSHSYFINSVCFSPDSIFFATGSLDGTMKIYNMKEVREYATLSNLNLNSPICFSPDSNFIAANMKDMGFKIWNIKELRDEYIENDVDNIKYIKFSPKGNFLAVGSRSTSIKILNITDKIEDEVEEIQSKNISFLCISPNLKYSVSSCSNINSMRFKDLENKSQKLLEGCLNYAHFASKNNSILLRTSINSFKIWDIDQNKHLEIKLDLSFTYSCISHDLEYIALVRERNCIYLYYNEKMEYFIYIIKEITSMSFSFDDENLAVGFSKGTIKVYNLKSKECYIKFRENYENITHIIFSHNNEKLFSVLSDSRVKVWNLAEEKNGCFLPFHQEKITSICISENDELLAAGYNDKTFQVLSLKSNEIVFSKSFSSSVICVRFSVLSNEVAVGLSEGVIKLWTFEERNKIDLQLNTKVINLEKDQYEILVEFPEYEGNDIIFFEKETFFVNEQEDLNEVHLNIEDFNDTEAIKNQSAMPQVQYEVEHTSFGFNILNSKGEKVRNFKIIDITDKEIKLQIKSKYVTINLNQALKINQVYKELLNFQKIWNTLVDIDSDILLSNLLILRPCSTFDTVHYHKADFTNAIYAISMSNYSQVSHENCNFLISCYKYSLFHFLSFLGNSKTLETLKNQSFLITADIFGKSPIFYAIMNKKLTCFEILLEILINFDEDDTSRLISSINSTRNDFLLIIGTSSVQLPEFLSKLVIKDESEIEVPLSDGLPFLSISECIIPKVNEFDNLQNKNQELNQKTAVLKYTISSLPVQPYSEIIIRALTVFYECKNKKIFDDFLIQFIINYNWKAVFYWAFTYSILIWIHIIFYFISLTDFQDISYMIPFWTTFCLILIWEILQFITNLQEYRYNPWNLVDIGLLLITPIWSVFRIMKIDFIYTDLILAAFLMIRGIVSFKIFNGTRYYIKLIIQSLNNIKYFLIIFIYSTIFFSIFLFIILDNDKNDRNNYFDIIKMSWALSVGGDTGIESQYDIIFLVVFMSTIFNLILMLNVLISILGDSYDQFSLDKNSIDYREKISLTLEFQTILFWKKNRNVLNFVHVIANSFETGLGDEDDWQGRIIFAEQRQEQRIDAIGKKIDLNNELIHKKIDNYNGMISKKIEIVENNFNEKISDLNSQLSKIADLLINGK